MNSSLVSRRHVAACSRDAEFDSFHGAALEEQPIWTALYENIRDALFPPKLPPLELTSKPVPVPDRMAVKTSPWAIGTSTILNGLILTMLVFIGMRAAINQIQKPASGAPIDLSDFRLFAPARASNGGGGGGSNDPVAPIEGRNPKFENMPLRHPWFPSFSNQSSQSIPPSISCYLTTHRCPTSAYIIRPTSRSTRMAPAFMEVSAMAPGAGIGPGSGPGYGPGTDGGVVYSPGRGVVAPVPIYAPDAEFSDEARRNRYQDICLISIIVDTHGNPQNPRVIQRLGMGLDEKALDAIRRYKFKPGTKDGKPVPVLMTIEVDFHMF